MSRSRSTVSPTLPFSIALIVPTLTPMPAANPRSVTPACLRSSRTAAPLSVIGCSATLNTLWVALGFRRLFGVDNDQSQHRAEGTRRVGVAG